MKNSKPEQLWDAIAVNIETSKVRIFGQNKTFDNAEAISHMAVMRRGCDEEFYTEVPAGTLKEGDTYKPSDRGETPASQPESRIISVGGMSYPRGPRGLDSQRSDGD